MRYLNDESSLKIAKDIWPNIDPYKRMHYIKNWKKEFENKDLIERNLKRNKKQKNDWEKFTKEELVEALIIYDHYIEIKNDNKKKWKKFQAIIIYKNSILSIEKFCLIFDVSTSGYYKHLKKM